MINQYKIKSFYYLAIVILIVVSCIYYAAKTMNNAPYTGDIIFANNIEDPKAFITPDIVPHIREIKEPERVRPCQPDPENNPEGIEYC